MAFTPITTLAYGNPYVGGWSNCTWGAWTLANEKLGIEMPSMGNAYQWFGSAQALGYATGYDPAPNSIIVWSGGRTGLGHVAYVDYVNPDGSFFIEEGGNNGAYCARTIYPWVSSSLHITGFIYLGDSTPISYSWAGEGEYTYSISQYQATAVNESITSAIINNRPKVTTESVESIQAPSLSRVLITDETTYTYSSSYDELSEEKKAIINGDNITSNNEEIPDGYGGETPVATTTSTSDKKDKNEPVVRTINYYEKKSTDAVTASSNEKKSNE